jgi:hypothetical protein
VIELKLLAAAALDTLTLVPLPDKHAHGLGNYLAPRCRQAVEVLKGLHLVADSRKRLLVTENDVLDSQEEFILRRSTCVND